MSATKRTVLILLGSLAAVFLVAQVVLGQLILSGRSNLIKAHQHTGYTTVVLALAYIGISLAAIAALPARREP
jgi:hypothetical protein